MDVEVFEQLQRDGLVADEALEQIKAHEKNRRISVHWDLRALLYLSILLLSGGLGILLYKNVDTIGHATIITLTGLLAAACFVYCFRLAAPFDLAQVASPNVWFDYILLLGCLLMLAFMGYLQYQYHVFGGRLGLAVFIPMLFLFFFAYYFDNRGTLSVAITNLGAWMGVAVEPMQLIRGLNFENGNLIINGVILGALLHLFSWLSGRLNFKPHFAIAYRNFGLHVLYISLIAGMFHFGGAWFLWFIALMAVTAYYVWQATLQPSFYFLVVSVLYGYVGVSYVAIRLLSKMGSINELAIYGVILYFIASGIGVAMLLMHFNKQLNKK